MTTTDTATILESFAVLAARFSEPGDQPDVTYVSFLEAIRGGPDPGRIIPYLTTLGLPPPQSLQQLHDTINAIPDEEELHAWIVTEGVAVSIASDNVWFVFTEPSP
jgi:hypothetical protein